ncbi:MAG TPA: hypothetical protein VJ810_11730 [Blastocatellia bacterium]|nr:hypothetical protein [Blastocatellia bacterium]
MAHSFDFPIKHLYPDHDVGILVAVFITYGGKYDSTLYLRPIT